LSDAIVLRISRAQVLAFRRRSNGLDARVPRGRRSLRLAAWAGLQDSMPRAALLSIHARVEGTPPDAYRDASLCQIWGPRFSVYVVAELDRAIFTLGRMPDEAKGRDLAEDLARRLHDLLGSTPMRYGDAGAALGEPPNRLRYATATGTVMMRWDGARQPVIWTVRRPDVDPWDARLELARRYLHVFGPSTASNFARWAGIAQRQSAATFEALARSLVAVRTPLGEAWIIARDEKALREPSGPAAAARLLPSGDAFTLVEDRALVVPDPRRRAELWTPRVWPGALLVDGDIAGTWRRANETMTIRPWRRLSRAERDAVEAEAASLPLPGLERPLGVRWE